MFLVGQVMAWWLLASAGHRLSTNPADAFFYLITAAHGLHVLGGLVALFGSLAPNGAILKRSAADPQLFEREGRAVVFSSLDDLAARVDDPALDVTAEDFMVLQNAGPKSGYAMPEAGYLPTG